MRFGEVWTQNALTSPISASCLVKKLCGPEDDFGRLISAIGWMSAMSLCEENRDYVSAESFRSCEDFSRKRKANLVLHNER